VGLPIKFDAGFGSAGILAGVFLQEQASFTNPGDSLSITWKIENEM
jgi:hypothetical protein